MKKNKADKIEVFATDFQDQTQSEPIRIEILKYYPNLKIHFDLEDCDKVLRVEGIFSTFKIKRIIRSKGYKCKTML